MLRAETDDGSILVMNRNVKTVRADAVVETTLADRARCARCWTRTSDSICRRCCRCAFRQSKNGGEPMSIYDEPKIDCHCHVFDPARFPYGEASVYRPAGQELGTAAQLTRAMDAYGVTHALLVGPNSGYEQDNRCLLDAIANGAGRFKGIAVVPNDIGDDALRSLRTAGIAGVAFNATFHGVDFYRDTEDLLARLAALDLCVSLQVQHDQLVVMAPMLERAGVRVLIDHCGRPTTATVSTSRASDAAAARRDRPRVRRCPATPVPRSCRFRMTMHGRTSTRCSTRSRRTAACGHRTGRSCAHRSESIMDRCCTSSSACSRRRRPATRALRNTAHVLDFGC